MVLQGRCVIIKLSANTIEAIARISHGKHAGHNIIIPSIPLIPTNSALPLDCFSICLTMAINKSQGQTFEAVGIVLTNL